METKEEYTNIFWFPDTQIKQPEHIWTRRSMKNTTDREKTLRAFWLYPELATGTGSEAFAMSCPTLNAVNMYERQGDDGIYYPITDPRSGYKFDSEHAFTKQIICVILTRLLAERGQDTSATRRLQSLFG